MKKGFVFTATLAALTLGLVACGGGGASVPDVSITNKNELQAEWFVEDDDRNLQMSIEGVRISDAIEAGDLVVTSSNPAVASLNQKTFRSVHAEGVGKTTITATYKNAKSDSVELEVKVRPTYRVATTLDPNKTDYLMRWYIGSKSYFAKGTKGTVDSGSPYYLDPCGQGDASQLSVAVEGEGDYKYSISFANGNVIGQKKDSSHVNIGFTSESGYTKSLFKFNTDYSLSCMIDGEEFFLAAYKGNNEKRLAFQKAEGIPSVGFARIVELGAPVPAESVTISASTLSLKAGEAGKLTAEVLPVTSTDVIAWESDTPAVALVEDGRVWALAEGEANIIATAGQKSASCKVTVSGTLNYGSEESPLTPEQAHDLLENNFKDGYQTVKMVWVSGIAHSVDKTYSSGNNVTVKLEKSDGTFEDKYFTVYGALPETDVATPEVGDRIVAKGYAKIFSGEYELTPGKLPTDEKNTNPKITSVTPAGPVELEDIEISGASAVNLHGKTEAPTVQLTATPVPAKADLGTVAWESSDPTNVEVSAAGLVTIPLDYVAAGGDAKEVTFTAKSGDVTSSKAFKITVTNEDEAPVEPVVLAKASITKTNPSGSATSYASYNGDHDFTDYAFTTTDVMPNAYVEQDVIQFKAKTGTLTMTKGAFSKVTLVLLTTYDWDSQIGINGNYGVTADMNANRVKTEWQYVDSKGNKFDVYQYTLVVELDGATEGITIAKHPDKNGAGYVTSITLE